MTYRDHVNEQRIKLEQRIVRRYLKACHAAGWKLRGIATADGEALEGMQDLFACDDARIFLEAKESGQRGWLLFIYGNAPGEVLSDYTTNLEAAVAPTSEWADQYA